MEPLVDDVRQPLGVIGGLFALVVADSQQRQVAQGVEGVKVHLRLCKSIQPFGDAIDRWNRKLR